MTPRTNPPSNLKHLNKLIVSRAGSEQLGLILRRSLATLIVCQMLPKEAVLESFKALVKGGTAMKLRMGRTRVRFSADLDVHKTEQSKTLLKNFKRAFKWDGLVSPEDWSGKLRQNQS